MEPNSVLADAALADALPAACRRLYVRHLDMFGSAAEGRFDPGRSDLDVLVTFETLSGGAYAASYFGLREAMRLPRDLLPELGASAFNEV